MLKITVADKDETSVTLKLEGRIAGRWVDELRKECDLCRDKGKQLILDLSGVSFVDDAGIKVLKTLAGRQVTLTNCSLFLSELFKNNEIPNLCQNFSKSKTEPDRVQRNGK
jgi:anti-anti-sigma regulatory factor